MIEIMKRTIYVRLMDEGTRVFRPVTATEIGDNLYEIDESNVYMKNDETWEFVPGTRVNVEQKHLSGKLKLVAISRSTGPQSEH
jgi:hypothetical protein